MAFISTLHVDASLQGVIRCSGSQNGSNEQRPRGKKSYAANRRNRAERHRSEAACGEEELCACRHFSSSG